MSENLICEMLPLGVGPYVSDILKLTEILVSAEVYLTATSKIITIEYVDMWEGNTLISFNSYSDFYEFVKGYKEVSGSPLAAISYVAKNLRIKS